jgi:hypothetical protein
MERGKQMLQNGVWKKKLQKDERAVSPAISTVIMTGTLIVLVFVAMSYANTDLSYQMAKGEFTANEQFMQSTGLQIDNAAWTIGRTETVDYTAKCGQVAFASGVLDYTFEISYNNGISWQLIYNCTTGMILFNMPTNNYNLGNNYFSRIVPASNGSFLQWGVSAPVCQVFASENVSTYGSYARVVAVPTVRAINSTISGETYYEFFLPTLTNATSPYLSQSLTLTGAGLVAATPSGNINEIRINATATSSVPVGFKHFTSAFFNFDHASETVPISGSSNLFGLYNGNVSVSIGLS